MSAVDPVQTCYAAALLSQTSTEDCELMPLFGQVMLGLTPNLSWERLEVQTDDDYILSMVHIFADSDGNPNDDALGPVMLVHGANTNGLSWFDSTEPTMYKSLVERLWYEGFDVYIPNLRGTLYSREHATLDLDSKEYWDYDIETVAKMDIPALVSAVLTKRQQDSKPC